jgi:vacuolar protein sorting-associated protein 41
LVGWADSFRHLQLVHTTISRTNQESQNGSAGVYIRARLIADWRADTIICGVSPFDQEHVLILGYLPPDENAGDLSIDGTDHQQRVDGPELLLMRRKDGLLKSADMLPVKSNDQMESLFTSPEQFHLLSNYSCYSRRTDYLKWNLDLPYDRGGYRGLPPHVYLLTPNGTIVSRVRDVNDRITAALQQNNLQLAADLAKAEKHTLRIYQYHDLVKAYVNSLLHEDQAELAAKECQRLIENDIENIPIWEHWINEFASRKRLTYIAPYVPVENPRLSNSIYEVILSNFLLVNSQAFLSAVRKSVIYFVFCESLTFPPLSVDGESFDHRSSIGKFSWIV